VYLRRARDAPNARLNAKEIRATLKRRAHLRLDSFRKRESSHRIFHGDERLHDPVLFFVLHAALRPANARA
jgi:hypothetical protein